METISPRKTLQLDDGALRRYVIVATGLFVALLAIPAAMGQENGPFLLLGEYAILLGGAVLVAGRTGPGGVRRLFSGLLHWRIGWLNWAVVIAAMPLVTIAVAVVSGTYSAPSDGWLTLVTDYLFTTFIFGALFINIAEESAWQGLVQRNLAGRYGLIKGAALTAIPFGVVHIPLSFGPGVTLKDSLIAMAVTFAVAPFMRYVVGRTDYVTGGSLLAAGVFHAGFNASGKLAVIDGWWQYAVALIVIGVIVLATDTLRARSTGSDLYDTVGTGSLEPALSGDVALDRPLPDALPTGRHVY